MNRNNNLYSRLSLTTHFSSYFIIAIVFGGLFPPLAIIGCISVILAIYVDQLLLGRLMINFIVTNWKKIVKDVMKPPPYL
jgi:hypothetical protein